MKTVLTFIIFLFLPLIGGMMSAALAGNMSGMYALLQQPPLSPPASIFPFVWTVLYLLMGLGSWLVYHQALQKDKNPRYYLLPYTVQLALNFIWSPMFFGAGQYWSAAWLAAALLVAIAWMMMRFARICRLAAWIQIPYFIWCAFAVYLSFGVAVLN